MVDSISSGWVVISEVNSITNFPNKEKAVAHAKDMSNAYFNVSCRVARLSINTDLSVEFDEIENFYSGERGLFDLNLLLINDVTGKWINIERKIQDFTGDNSINLVNAVNYLIGDDYGAGDIVGILYPASGKYFQSCRVSAYQGDSFIVVI
jgi:hypothetical protein